MAILLAARQTCEVLGRLVRTPWLFLIPLCLVLGCGAPPPAIPSEESIGLRRDCYVLPAQAELPDPQTSEERARLEIEWPAVDALSLPNYSDARRVAYRQPVGAPPLAAAASFLPPCGTAGAADRACLGTVEGGVLLRAESNGYGAPRLTLIPAR